MNGELGIQFIFNDNIHFQIVLILDYSQNEAKLLPRIASLANCVIVIQTTLLKVIRNTSCFSFLYDADSITLNQLWKKVWFYLRQFFCYISHQIKYFVLKDKLLIFWRNMINAYKYWDKQIQNIFKGDHKPVY